MKVKTPGQVIKVLKDDLSRWNAYYAKTVQGRHYAACLQRAIAIVRLWQAGITPADVRKSERKGKGSRG